MRAITAQSDRIGHRRRRRPARPRSRLATTTHEAALPSLTGAAGPSQSMKMASLSDPGAGDQPAMRPGVSERGGTTPWVTISPSSGSARRTRSPRLPQCGSPTRSATELTGLAGRPAPRSARHRLGGGESAPRARRALRARRDRRSRAAEALERVGDVGPARRRHGDEAAVRGLDGETARVERAVAAGALAPDAERAPHRERVAGQAQRRPRTWPCRPPAPARPRRGGAARRACRAR